MGITDLWEIWKKITAIVSIEPAFIAALTACFVRYINFRYIVYYNTFKLLKKQKLMYHLILYEGLIAFLIFFGIVDLLKLDISIQGFDGDKYLEAILIGIISRNITYIEIPKNNITNKVQKIDIGVIRRKLEGRLKLKHYNNNLKRAKAIAKQIPYRDINHLRKILAQTIPNPESVIVKAMESYTDPIQLLLFYFEEVGDDQIIDKDNNFNKSLL